MGGASRGMSLQVKEPGRDIVKHQGVLFACAGIRRLAGLQARTVPV